MYVKLYKINYNDHSCDMNWLKSEKNITIKMRVPKVIFKIKINYFRNLKKDISWLKKAFW